MARTNIRRLLGASSAGLALAILLVTGTSAARDWDSIYSFTGGNDGGDPATSLIFDRAGNVFGTSVVGGTAGCGTVFTMKPLGNDRWQETALFSFDCFATGKNPYGGVIFDRSGNLYGTTVAGGSGGACASDGCGTVFELTPKGETVLYSFTGGTDGFGPGGGVVFNKAGDLFGTTPDGGAYSAGTVYELVRHGSHWQESIIHSFTGGSDGATGSLGSLLVDAKGNLYGVTELGGGSANAGTVFEMSPRAHGQWTFTTLYTFKGTPDAGSPYGGLIADAHGNLFGTTYQGGSNNAGTVFALTRGQNGYTERVLYGFKGGQDGSYPTSTLVFDGTGYLYGTTSMGGGVGCDCGTVFQVNASSGKESVLHRFTGAPDGGNPYYGLARDRVGNLYATTVVGGVDSQGLVFEFTP